MFRLISPACAGLASDIEAFPLLRATELSIPDGRAEKLPKSISDHLTIWLQAVL